MGSRKAMAKPTTPGVPVAVGICVKSLATDAPDQHDRAGGRPNGQQEADAENRRARRVHQGYRKAFAACLRFQEGIVDQSRPVDLYGQQNQRRAADLPGPRQRVGINQGNVIDRGIDVEDLLSHCFRDGRGFAFALAHKPPRKLQLRHSTVARSRASGLR